MQRQKLDVVCCHEGFAGTEWAQSRALAGQELDGAGWGLPRALAVQERDQAQQPDACVTQAKCAMVEEPFAAAQWAVGDGYCGIWKEGERRLGAKLGS